ncbi:unnamed protein product [Dicrocoelium dendriticum]|nr:unnamed protein product [Dicrocoelium dendriticum]
MEPFSMVRLLLCLSWFTSTCVASGKDTPMAVAFSCGRPSLFLTEEGWIQDSNQHCLHAETNILEYCQTIYPDKGIVRAMFSPVIEVNLEGWCPIGLSVGCSRARRENYSIQPWVCSAQTQRILLSRIPPSCRLLKLETTAASVCQKESYWSDLASVHCQKIHRLQYTKPCIKPDVYTHLHFLGADLVCCEPETPDVADAPAYHRYLSILPNEVDKLSERNQFIAAKAALNESVRKKRKLLERRLIEAQSNLSHDEWLATPELTQASESAAHKEFRQQFVKLLAEAEVLGHRLDAVHQRRVLKLMKTHETEAALAWNTAINSYPPNLTQIQHSAEHLVSVIQRNRHHLIKRFEHLRSVSPMASGVALQELKRNLADLNHTMESNLEKLELVPTYKFAVLEFVTNLLNTKYSELNAFARSISSLNETGNFTPSQKEYVLQAERIIEKYRHHLPALDLENPTRVVKKIAKVTDGANEPIDGREARHRPITLEVQTIDGRSLVSESRGNLSTSATSTKTNANSTRYMSHRPTGSASSSSVVAIVLSLLLCVGIAIFAVYACHFRLRRMRLRRAGYSPTVIEVPEVYNDRSLLRTRSVVGSISDDPELLSHWQLNGYENPAYKFPNNIVRFPHPS